VISCLAVVADSEEVDLVEVASVVADSVVVVVGFVVEE
jgi:hypothetical protein